MQTEMVAMSDGVRLATDVYLPEGAGPWPVVLERTPHGRGAARPAEMSLADSAPRSAAGLAAAFTERGYAVVFQDCRGRGGSGGHFASYLDEAEDGAAACAWITEQSWCDGHICTIGLSYCAHTQAALGALDPPGLSAQVLDCGGFWDAWSCGVRQGGAFELRQAIWSFRRALNSPEAMADPVLHAALATEDLRAWVAALPWTQGQSPLRHLPAYEADLFERMRHGTRDGFWRRAGIWTAGYHHRYSRADCVHLSAWFDPYAASAIGNFTGLHAAGRGRQRLILGPWTHGARSVRIAGDVDFGPDAAIDSWAGDWISYRLRHFDSVTRGVPCREPPVRVFVMGGGSGRRTAEGYLDHGGRWIAAEEWPVPEAERVPLYLHNDLRLTQGEPAASSAPLRFDFDPAHPVPTIGGNFTSMEPLAFPGSFDQVTGPEVFGAKPPYLPLTARHDVLAFQTAPLKQPVQVVGPVEIELYVATDGPDTDFTVKLVDVHPASADYPRGYAMLLADTIQRLRYVEDPSQPRLHRPGEVVRAKFVLPIANLFAAGHRIRLDISSSNFPKFDVNPNTGEPEGAARRRRVAVNTVFVEAARPSRMVLPVLAL